MAGFSSLRLPFSSFTLPNPSSLLLSPLPKSRSLFLLHQDTRNLRVFSSSPCPNNQGESSQKRWESFPKKKIVMRVGYVGSDSGGLQKRQDAGSLSTIEGELESAIFKAGGILDSNYGNLHKIGWARSSRTDKGVHSLATMISLKMEIPLHAWKEDPCGIILASYVNVNLPNNIKVFNILPSQGDQFFSEFEKENKASYLDFHKLIGTFFVFFSFFSRVLMQEGNVQTVCTHISFLLKSLV